MTDLRKLKDQASAAFAKGKFAKAAELYEACCNGDPKDLQARLRMGDAFAKAGAKEKAIGAYKFAAEGFARDGFLPRAIAASKLILELDPTHTGVQQMLAGMYAKRGTPAPKKPEAPGTSAPPAAAAKAPATPAAPSTSSFGEIDLPTEDAPPPPAAAAPVAPPPSPAPPAAMSSAAAVSVRPGPPPAAPPPKPPASGNGVNVIDLSDEAGVALEVEGSATPQAAPADSNGAGVELELEAPAPPPKAPAPDPEPEEIVADVVESPAAAPPRPSAPAATAADSDVESADDLVADEAPGEVIELTVKKPAAPEPPPAPRAAPVPLPPPSAAPSPTASRIWIPDTFSPPAGAAPTSRAQEAAPSQQLVAASAATGAGKKGASDLQAGLAALARFDELEMDMAPAPAVPPTPPEPPASQAPPPAARSMSISVSSFAELEMEGDSLLHAVELAAQRGISERAEPAEAAEDSMSQIADEMPGESQTAAGLPQIPLFSDLPPDAFIELFERCPLRRFGQDERVVEQGSVGDSFFVICAGSVKVVRQDADMIKELAQLPEGSFFGEMALLSGAPRTASVLSNSEETQLLEISGPILAELSKRYPQVSVALKKFCRQRMLTNVMNTSALFKPFGKKDRKELVERFRARDVRKNDVIIKDGAMTDGLYVVLSGEVEVTKGATKLATLKEGEIFGEMSLLKKTPAGANVAAAKHTSLLRLPREAFDEIILSHPQVLSLISELSDSRTKSTDAALSGDVML